MDAYQRRGESKRVILISSPQICYYFYFNFKCYNHFVKDNKTEIRPQQEVKGKNPSRHVTASAERTVILNRDNSAPRANVKRHVFVTTWDAREALLHLGTVSGVRPGMPLNIRQCTGELTSTENCP